MNEQLALRRAIVAEPDNDTPRLVYADWLDENGYAERAAFIRHQVSSGRATETVNEITAREGRHLSEPGDFPGAVYAGYVFRRGFVETVSCTLDSWLRNGTELLELNPIIWVRIRDKSPLETYEGFCWTGVPRYGQLDLLNIYTVPEPIAAILRRDCRRLRHPPSITFGSFNEAMDALNDAALRWAKEAGK